MNLKLQLKTLRKDGKVFYVYNGKAYPKEFAWFIVAKMLEERGYNVFFDYGNGMESEVKWGFNRKDGVAPVTPQKLIVFKAEGEPFAKKIKRIEIENTDIPDPDPETSVNMIEVYI